MFYWSVVVQSHADEIKKNYVSNLDQFDFVLMIALISNTKLNVQHINQTRID